ncbi:MAG: tyrosine-type recombinase/integrase [Deltaproteobacteria bacterium]|nr:tyrosine-type recombinase/integrase [Deltaproteobacteria bacterium]
MKISQKGQKAKPKARVAAAGHSKPTPKRTEFVPANDKAKSAIVAKLVRLSRRARLDYDEFLYVCQQARRKLGLRRPKRQRALPKLLSQTELKKFFKVIEACGDLEHEIMLKLLFYTAVRVSELVQIAVADVDIERSKIFIRRGKGAKDRYILFPRSFRLVLKTHLAAHAHNRFLFESRRFGPYTTRRVQQIVQRYREEAEIADKVHPHLFRHQMLTFLTSRGLSDAQLQLISGHDSKKSLEVYQHLSLARVETGYQAAVADVGV